MEAYTDFASVYDTFMDNTPYAEWAGYIVSLLERYGVPEYGEALEEERNVIVDLGCGTGTLTELLADAGYDMIGIDSSQEMLNIALEKRERSGRDILYLQLQLPHILL